MRNIKKINDAWLFSKGVKAAPEVMPEQWTALDLPFTWNGLDGQDGGNDYYRGKGCFVKRLKSSDFPQGDVHYIQFDGVNSSAEVFFNGKLICTHHGGYSTFRARLDDIHDENILCVIADNSVNDTVYPQMADFTFYGGIYRDVSLIGVKNQHFELDYFGGSGIKITPTVVDDHAEVEVVAYAKNSEGCKAVFTVFSEDGAEVASSESDSAENFRTTIKIDNPHLWHGTRSPYLYSLKAELVFEDLIVDEISISFGIRSFEIDPDKGFILNGEPYPLRGVARHQDRPQIGNALLHEHHLEDIELITEMGANTVRLAHYQHSQDFYELCDKYGLVVWAEIPYISEHLKKGFDNTKSQMQELIIQNYNHPSIVVWGLSNEISMNSALNSDLINNHKMLNDLAHSLDKTRKTVLAVLSLCSPDEEYVHLTDVVSYNHYFGWYGGEVSMYKPWYDKFHKKYPNKAIGLSEYGCEALNWHSSQPMQGDYTEEYQAYYHEEMIKQIIDMPYLWATHVWNMFDFAADARAEGGENGMNHKGLVSFDRKYKKDSFYAYKAWLSTEPFVHICSKRYIKRVEENTKITVYSNLNEVSLYVDGKLISTQKKEKYPFFYFNVPNVGSQVLLAKSGEYTDTATIEKVEEFEASYRMDEGGEVLNWFEITCPEGRLSINDNIGTIMSTFRGKLFMLKLAKIIINKLKSKKSKQTDDNQKEMSASRSFSINKTTIELAKGFSVKRVVQMLNLGIPKAQMIELNEALNKIKKPK